MLEQALARLQRQDAPAGKEDVEVAVSDHMRYRIPDIVLHDDEDDDEQVHEVEDGDEDKGVGFSFTVYE